MVSHSLALAKATLRLMQSMVGQQMPIAVAAGTGEDFDDLGTDATEIYAGIESVMGNDGVLVLMDIGSAILSAEMAMEFMDEEVRKNVKLCPSPFVEGAISAVVAAKSGNSLEEVYRETTKALQQKLRHLGVEEEENVASDKEEELKAGQKIQVVVPNPFGFHARPVAKLIEIADAYKSKIQIQNKTDSNGPVNIRSMSAVIGLEVLKGHKVELIAKGKDAEVALAKFKEEIEKGLGDSLEDLKEVQKPQAAKTKKSEAHGIHKGIVIGNLFPPKPSVANISRHSNKTAEEEIKSLQKAIKLAQDELTELPDEIAFSSGGEEVSEIFKAQAAMLNDTRLVEKAKDIIKQKYFTAPWAWSMAVDDVLDEYKKLKDHNLQLRALDLQDVARLVLDKLGVPNTNVLDIPEEGILLVDDITPAQVTALDTEKIKGVICLQNGPTSHSSILLRSRGIPTIIQAENFIPPLERLMPSDLVVMNGGTGAIEINPKKSKLKAYQQEKQSFEKQSRREKEESSAPAKTLDDKQINVFANIGRADDVKDAIENGAEGVGLLRTEFMFIERDRAPSEKEQVGYLKKMLQPLKGKSITVRTLDAGGDKELPYLNMAKEDNPFLGIRAIRLTLRNKELFQQQLRAILRVSEEFDMRIMFPMIGTLEELAQAKKELENAHESLVEEGIAHTWPIPTGMMMEVPSAAINAWDFAKEVDFFSIGTNDLIQYTMAVDRGNTELQQALAKGLPMAVRRLIQIIVKAAKEQNIPVAVCGEAAAKPELAGVLLGLDIRELSMSPKSIPSLKYWVRDQSISELMVSALQ